jgi:ribosomal protein S18 acetylase RimI-like enzyme
VTPTYQKDYDAISGNHPRGRTLLAAVEARMREIGLPGIAVETQDINVAACRLYASAGYAITRTDANAYPDLAAETQIIWTKRLR